ncbi:AAA family ATPase [Anaerostipes sp.]|uniref:AAA family ATPase n=1 Tax=Anaerostipes sp. TaxID=1872530 RepID=UPI0025BF7E9B|nr:AAA family ATPase [Anaerostipes sp.]MBS7006936.1 AAA family ATPase [Anaerostipes sp.]
MKKTLILLAGYPGTGKTYMCSKILEQEKDFQVISQDDMKEQLWDQYGFNNMEEKTALENKSWELYYEKIEDAMKKESRVISDYPFSDKQKGRLKKLCENYGYQAVTIRLVGDLEVLFERSRQRDLDTGRHLAHVVSRYHKGDVLSDRTKGDCFVNHEIFMERCRTRGYGEFQLGRLIEVDVTDYSRIDYEKILGQLKKWL